MEASDHGYLGSVLVLLIAALLAVALMQRVRISPVLGYLVAGLAVGPSGLQLIGDVERVAQLAEFGVIFLLFTIGLDLPLHRLQAMWRYIFGLGLAQVALTSLVFGTLAFLFGATPEAALVIGGALAFSSTATVLALLRERRETASRLGRVALAVLLFQDLAVVPLLAIMPLLGTEGTALIVALGLALAKAIAALTIIIALGTLVLRPLYRQIAALRNPELFAGTTLLVALGTGWATAQAGLPMALGAFLAGLLLAGTEYRHQVAADIQPFRDLFLGLFFITVGMSIDLTSVARHIGPMIGLTVAVIATKTVVLGVLGLASGLTAALTARLALILAQCGEFAFVVFSLTMLSGLIPAETGQLLIAVVAVTIAATPLLNGFGRRLSSMLERPRTPETARLASEAGDLVDHFIIAGFGRLGGIVGDLLAAQQTPYIAIDLDAQHVVQQRKDGAPIYFGDASQPEVLRAAGADRARGVIVALNAPEAAEQIVGTLRRDFPDLMIIVRGRDSAHGARLARAGARTIILEALEPGLQMAASALRAAGATSDEVAHALEKVRQRTAAETSEPNGSSQ
jgi:monovalent cation:H+ antiporter-2, CPA2 family